MKKLLNMKTWKMTDNEFTVFCMTVAVLMLTLSFGALFLRALYFTQTFDAASGLTLAAMLAAPVVMLALVGFGVGRYVEQGSRTRRPRS